MPAPGPTPYSPPGAVSWSRGATGQLLFVGGAGADYVRGNSSQATIMYGGTGSDTLIGGTGGPNVLVAGSGNDTLVAASPGDLMFGGSGFTGFVSPGGYAVMVGGTGRNVFDMSDGDVAFGNSGSDTFVIPLTVAERAVVVEGSGTENVEFGIGPAIAFGGQGNDTYAVKYGPVYSGTIEIVGFKPSDHLDLRGLSSAEVQDVVANAATGAWGTTLSLPSGTQIVLFSVHGLNGTQVL